MKNNKSVLIAMSGGIDSSVAAFLLKEKGYQVTGIYFQLVGIEKNKEYKEKEPDNCYPDRQRVRKIAQKLGIPLYEVDYRKEFNNIVVNDFIIKYQSGLTPNPCVLCNEKVKFRLLLHYALKNNIQFIATGHYVRIEKNEKQNKTLLKRGLDRKKDQSYFLYRLSKNILSKCIFPLGSLMKRKVEKIACEIGLEPSKIKESQEICFIPGNNYRKLIEHRVTQPGKNQPGYFVDTSGNILGRHKGIAFYTIGQRRKIGLSLNTRKYIVRISPKSNKIVIGDEQDLYRREFKVVEVHYISRDPIMEPVELQVQIRYHTPPACATIFPCQKNSLYIIFNEPMRAITPGQSAVFYDKDIVVGGGIIGFLN
ncbi:MAG TPA: tRNA 2-thiouridine(34) synthase MnmA [Atribacterota bacterium]|nr:tRNA 2-thiouridine(34) synthase MnmA [Atribacterota bacterium]